MSHTACRGGGRPGGRYQSDNRTRIALEAFTTICRKPGPFWALTSGRAFPRQLANHEPQSTSVQATSPGPGMAEGPPCSHALDGGDRPVQITGEIHRCPVI
jgi:hypothetical protein